MRPCILKEIIYIKSLKIVEHFYKMEKSITRSTEQAIPRGENDLNLSKQLKGELLVTETP
jgi:hypothetical protein